MKILFIGHDASRTGAPLLLLQLMSWLKVNYSDIEFDCLLLDGGELEKEYQSTCKVYYREPKEIKRLSYIKRILKRIFRIKHNIRAAYYDNLFNKLKSNNYDVIYGNTIVSSNAILELTTLIPHAKILMHVHELYDITRFYSDSLNKLSVTKIKIITVSQITKQNLIKNHGISESSIELVYEYIDTKKITEKQIENPTTKFIVNGSGLVQVRKGYDIFISVAKRAIQKYPDIPFHFKWIGTIPEYLSFYIQNDIEMADLNGIVEFIGAKEDPYFEFSSSSVFLMTSRQDPFPLVCIEHALLGKPIICFDKVSGIPELVGDDAGIVVPYLDIEVMVDALQTLYSNPDKLAELGKKASQKALNYDIDIQAGKIVEIIKKTLL